MSYGERNVVTFA